MIEFLLKGLLRDRQRSLVPILVVTLGVMLTVVFQAWITGIMADSIEFTAMFTTGHVKVMTKAYAENVDQMPNDLALTGADSVMQYLASEFPEAEWVERIHFAGLIDVPDANGETKQQGAAVGFAIRMLSGDQSELNRMKIKESMVKGHLPRMNREILLSDQFAEKLGIQPGDPVSLISSTMFGEMSVYNFTLAGTVAFGSTALDRGTVIADLSDVREALNMENSCGEILGFLKSGYYDDKLSSAMATRFSEESPFHGDEFVPVMKTLKRQNNMEALVDYESKLIGILIAVFMAAMSLVLWNAGLLGGLRRYGEFGMRLAIGEEKDHVYKTMIYESLLIGFIGSVIGVAVGMLFAWYLEKYGIRFDMMKNAKLMLPSVFKARITPFTWDIGFIPGELSTLIGTLLSGIGIYKRQTAQLFKELET
jgi:putative ABC transport system permease protein